eukprot:1324029-Amorphochlora_amoeboformis.AAC.1
MTTLSRVDTQAVQHEYKQLRAAAKAHPGTCRLPTTAQVCYHVSSCGGRDGRREWETERERKR